VPVTTDRIEAIRRGIEAFNRRDFDAAMADLHDDIVWERFLSRAEAGTPAVRGKEALRAVWESQVDAVDIRFEPDEYHGVGDKVVTAGRMVARGSGSQIVLSTPVTWAWTFGDDGLVVQVTAFEDLAEALAR
jgi:ketosteroid isomerase-like protein